MYVDKYSLKKINLYDRIFYKLAFVNQIDQILKIFGK